MLNKPFEAHWRIVIYFRHRPVKEYTSLMYFNEVAANIALEFLHRHLIEGSTKYLKMVDSYTTNILSLADIVEVILCAAEEIEDENTQA